MSNVFMTDSNCTETLRRMDAYVDNEIDTAGGAAVAAHIESCPSCRGEGRHQGSSKVNIKVPPGVSSGNYMTVESMGNAARQNGEPGDLVASVRAAEAAGSGTTRPGDPTAAAPADSQTA